MHFRGLRSRERFGKSPRSTTPILSPQTVAATEQAIAQYQGIAARGGWGTVPAGATLKVGVKSAAVTALRQRLMASGDLDPSAGSSPVFDSYVEAGVKRFQARHGVAPTGVVAQQTFAALNVPVGELRLLRRLCPVLHDVSLVGHLVLTVRTG